MSDLFYSIVLFSIVILIALAYLLRVFLKGRATFERVDRQGGSLLLGKSLMEMAYWSLQPLAKLIMALKISATALSFFALGLGIVVGCLLALGHFGAASIIAVVASIMDVLDGMVARSTGTVNSAGKVLDSSLDRYVEFFFLGGLIVYYQDVTILQVLTLFALLASFMVSYSSALAEIMNVQVSRGVMRRPERLVYLIAGAALSPLTIATCETQQTIFATPVGYPMVLALGLLAVVGNISAARRLMEISGIFTVNSK